MSLKENEKNISRVDFRTETSPARGFLVRVMRRGEKYQKFFGDKSFGGKTKALSAAKKFRDEVLAQYRGFSKRELAEKVSVRNTSGVVGVRYAEEFHGVGKGRRIYGFWVASWNPTAGTRKTKRFSIDKYGDDEAMRLAIKAREDGVRAAKS